MEPTELQRRAGEADARAYARNLMPVARKLARAGFAAR